MIGAQIRLTARLALVPVAVIVTVALAGCGTVGAPAAPASRSASASSSAVTGPTRQLNSFLTVTTTPAVTRTAQSSSFNVVLFPVATLQMRSAHGGKVIATLLRSPGSIDAVMTRSGSVIAVEDLGCRSLVMRIDPRTGQAKRLRVLAGSVSHIALSPDGRELAYLTYGASNPRPCGPAVRQPAAPVQARVTPGDPIQLLPNVVAVTGLFSGAIAESATSNLGQPPTAPAWSPDGSRIAVTSTSDHSIALLSAVHPDFATAQRILPPRGCGYLTTTWTSAGLVAVAGCGQNAPDLLPQTLVRLSPGGQELARSRLPACVGGIQAFADPTGSHVLIQADIGYGSGPPCGISQPGGSSIRVAVVHGTALTTIATFAREPAQLEVTGW